MKLNIIAAGTLALFTAFAAQATTFDLGSLAPQTKVLPSESFGIGSFSYDFTFTTTSNDIFSVGGGDALTIKFLKSANPTNPLTEFSANIDGHDFGAFGVSDSSKIGTRPAWADTLTYDASKGLELAKGVTHTLHIQGTSSKASSLNGSFYLVGAPVAAVPEPESYALMLAGLGAIATIVRRRKNAA